MPRPGGRVRIAHFGGGHELGTILAVRDGGRVLEVRDESGATREFVLNPATARFLAAGSGQGERLELLGEG
jgi:hypothetical protein